MPSYQCKIGTSDGRVVDRVYDSASREQLRENLEEQGFHVFRIQRQGFSLFQQGPGRSSRLTGSKFIAFNQEMLVLLRSGLPMLQVFETQIEQLEAGPFRDVIVEIREEIRGGSSLSDAFAKFPRAFPPLYVASVRAGEKTGDVPQTLARYMDYQKRVEAIRAKVRSASFYPLLLTAAAVIVVVFLMLYVVPRFTQIYADANVALPLMTRMLIALSELIGHYWFLLLIAAIGVSLAVRVLSRTTRGRLRIDRLLLRVPFVGGLTVD